MDKWIRRLERRYQSSGSADDILAWAHGMIRAGLLASFQDELSAMAGENTPPIHGFNFVEEPIIFRFIARVIGQWDLRNLTEEQLQQAVAPPSLEFRAYTITRVAHDCPYCGSPVPHTCIAYNQTFPPNPGGHPYREEVTLPINPDWYGLVEPISSHHDYNVEEYDEDDDYYSDDEPEQEPEATPQTARQWHPTKPRQMKQEYTYTVHRWIIRSFSSQNPHNIPLQNGWHIHFLTDIESLSNRAALHKRVAQRNTGQFRDLIEITDVVDVHNPQGQDLYNSAILAERQIFPIPIEHELPQAAPYIVIGPCKNFEIIPKGDEIYLPELDQYVPTGITVTIYEESGTPGVLTVPHAVEAYDTSTKCKHGHIKGFPLCPPRWSDTGQLAAIHCESCARLLPLEHESKKFTIRKPSGEFKEYTDPFHMCDDCLEKINRQTSIRDGYLHDYMSELGEGMWFFCQTCEEEGDGGYTEEDCYCFELAAEEGTPPPILEKRYRCPHCAISSNGYQRPHLSDYTWYPTAQKAIDCCTKIRLWDFSTVFDAYGR